MSPLKAWYLKVKNFDRFVEKRPSLRTPIRGPDSGFRLLPRTPSGAGRNDEHEANDGVQLENEESYLGPSSPGYYRDVPPGHHCFNTCVLRNGIAALKLASKRLHRSFRKRYIECLGYLANGLIKSA
jgi:hypothetical protein